MTPTPPPRTCSAAGEDLDEAVVTDDLLEDVAGEYLRRRSCCVRAMVAVSDNCSPSADMDLEDDKVDDDNGEEPRSKL